MPNRAFFEWFFNSDLFVSGKQHAEGKIWGFYDYFKDEPSRLATSRRRYEELRPWLEGEGRPLDILKIGPSTGTFLHVANEHGHNAIGCDVSAQFVDYARETYGVRIDHGRFEELGYEDGRFDAIFLFNVIENVPNQEEFLREVHRCLKPGGYFVVNFVDMKHNLLAKLQGDRYFIYRPPICYVYDRDVMRRVLGKFGFEVVKRLRDRRYLTVEKVSTLLGWRWPLVLAGKLGLHRKKFRIYAYPSWIWIARRSG
jgi:SAM-dependent methyltransferase